MSTLEFLEGPMRNGKSLLANIKIFSALRAGAVCGINYELIENWAWIYAKRTAGRFENDKKTLQRAVGFWDRMWRYGSVDSLELLCSKAQESSVGKRAKTRERKGCIIMDECGLYLNARYWDKHMDFIQLLTRLGKYECEMFMISHSHEDIDKQVQRKIEVITSIRNMQRRKICGIPIGALCKKPKFRTISTIAGSGAGKGVKEDHDWFGLDLKTCDLYDTFFMFDMSDADRGLTKLGKHPEILYEQMTRSRRYESFAMCSPSSSYPEQQFYGF
ncbi:MAG: hypothetical protein OCC45_06340 [Desulfotalea sp.]